MLFGLIGISVFVIELYFVSYVLLLFGYLLLVGEFLVGVCYWCIFVDLFLFVMFGGFYSVLLYVLI